MRGWSGFAWTDRARAPWSRRRRRGPTGSLSGQGRWTSPPMASSESRGDYAIDLMSPKSQAMHPEKIVRILCRGRNKAHGVVVSAALRWPEPAFAGRAACPATGAGWSSNRADADVHRIECGDQLCALFEYMKTL